MSDKKFLELPDLVLIPPLPMLVAVAMLSGAVWLAWKLATFLRRGKHDALDVSACFVVSIGFLAAFFHALAWAQLASLLVLRACSGALAGLGLYAIFTSRRRIFALFGTVRPTYLRSSAWERLGIAVVGMILLCLAMAALAPATDADSLAYHLGVSLDWLRHGGAYPRPDWVHSRLAGLGEVLNMLGLAAGTDCLGACLQWSGVVVAAVALGSLSTSTESRLLAWLLVAASPVVLFLVPNQKAQMLPVAATVVAVVVALRKYQDFGRIEALYAFGCISFAAGCKLSFLLSGMCAACVCAFAAFQSGKLRMALSVGGGVFAIVLLPLLVRKYAFYGDPFSPILERWTARPNVAVQTSATILRNLVHPHTFGGIASLFRELVLPRGLGELSTTLGIGSIAVVAVVRPKPLEWMLLAIATLSAILVLTFGSLEPRYLQESYLWAGAVVVGMQATNRRRWLLRALVVQGAIVAGAAAYGGATLFPGALWAARRQQVLYGRACGYSEAMWLDRILPPGAIMATYSRFAALFPRPFVIMDLEMSGKDWRPMASEFIRQFNVDTIIVNADAPESPLTRLANECGTLLDSRAFSNATRNPFQSHVPYTVQAFHVGTCK